MYYKPRVRNGFSDRNNIDSISKSIQKFDFDEMTRNNIVNFIDDILESEVKRGDKQFVDKAFEYIYKNIFAVTKDEIPFDQFGYSNRRKDVVDCIKILWNYADILSFLEEFANYLNDRYRRIYIYDNFNSLFKRECMGYRFVDKYITDIIDEVEIQEIEKAVVCKYDGCKNSIRKALDSLYNRDFPDYENSVKESISAIEGMCNIITKSENSTLGLALSKLESNGVKIHGALNSAYRTLYGYTSDENGIRHNYGISSNTTFEEAKYMLVSCSAFLNYLISIYENLDD